MGKKEFRAERNAKKPPEERVDEALKYKINWEALKGMSSPTEIEIEGGGSPNNLCTIEASSITGFEVAAQQEAKDKLNLTEVHKYQGRIIFDLPQERIQEVLKLRCIENVWVLIGARAEMDLTGEKESCLTDLIDTIHPLQWERGLRVWNRIFDFKGTLYPNKKGNPLKEEVKETPEREKKKVEEDTSAEPEKKPKLSEEVATVSDLAKFRCTCYRSGEDHPFSSMEAAKEIGGAIQDKFLWKVQMKGWDIEVVVNINKDQIYYGIALNKVSLFKRNITHFGPTTLRATICSSMLKFADIKLGDVVVDPMCGGGSIPLEGALGYSEGYHLGGDLHDKAYRRARDNVLSLEEKNGVSLQTDVVHWDATNVPLRDGSVDVFITDLPFGRRSGSTTDNRVLYPKILNSMAKAVRPKTGRAVLLTHDKTSMFKCMGKINPYWKTNKYSYANIGGLAALVFLMTRTDKTPE